MKNLSIIALTIFSLSSLALLANTLYDAEPFGTLQEIKERYLDPLQDDDNEVKWICVNDGIFPPIEGACPANGNICPFLIEAKDEEKKNKKPEPAPSSPFFEIFTPPEPEPFCELFIPNDEEQ